jgi:ubiquinone/menaquinone biosynthesis C-methylase UbiE
VGVDRSEAMLEMAQRRNQALVEAGRVELHLGTVGELPFGDATFDKAMTMNSLHLWPDAIGGLREIRRTLRPGGRIAVAITRFSYASPDKFEPYLLDAGFTDVHVHNGKPGTCTTGRA